MKKHIDMMPEEYFVRALTRQRVSRWVAFGALVTAGVLAMAYPINARARQKTVTLVPLRENVANMERWGERIAPVTNELREAGTHQDVVKELLNEPFWNGFLSDVAAATGGELWITQVEMEKHLIQVEKIQKEVPLVTISGMAPSNFEVIRFLRRLSESEHLESIELEVSRAPRTKDEKLRIEFIAQGVAK